MIAGNGFPAYRASRSGEPPCERMRGRDDGEPSLGGRRAGRLPGPRSVPRPLALKHPPARGKDAGKFFRAAGISPGHEE